MPPRAAFILILGVLIAGPAAAQTPPSDPPGPGRYVFDLRGALLSFPRDATFFPPVPSGTIVPARGFGFDVGGHVYLFRLGPSRLGVGVSLLRARHKTSPASPAVAPTVPPGTPPPARTIPDVEATLTTIAPQLSFNFGTRRGWSYLSAGMGVAELATATSGTPAAAARDSGRLSSINVGGGARWFRSPRLAFNFDVRFHIVSADEQPVPHISTPRTTLVSAGVGISLR